MVLERKGDIEYFGSGVYVPVVVKKIKRRVVSERKDAVTQEVKLEMFDVPVEEKKLVSVEELLEIMGFVPKEVE